MIKIVNGDLLEAKEKVIGHQVNCQGKMNSGVAKQIREKFPNVYTDYKKMVDFVDDRESLLGHIFAVPVKGEKIVVNMFGQLNYGYDGGQYTNIKGLRECLEHLRAVAEENNLSVALPYKLGSDRGGADWNEVYSLIDEIFDGYEVTLYKI